MRIAIIGPEASGKTELAKFLASTLGGVATEEYARAYFADRKLPADHILSTQEMRDVMRGQRAAEQGQGLLFIDASTIHGPLYASMERRGESLSFDGPVDAEVMDYATSGGYDGFVLCQPHAALEWMDDGMRSMPDLKDRHAFAGACHAFVAKHYAGKPCMIVDADSWNAREAQATEKLKKIL